MRFSIKSRRALRRPLTFTFCHQFLRWFLPSARPSVFFPSLFPSNPERRWTRPVDLLSLLHFSASLCLLMARDSWAWTNGLFYGAGLMRWVCSVRTSLEEVRELPVQNLRGDSLPVFISTVSSHKVTAFQ